MTAPAQDRADARYLRAELLLRMAVQNLVLILNALLFAAAAALQLHGAAPPAALATAYGLAALILAAIWCHHGARQAQIKRYLMVLEARAGAAESWETWLPRHGFAGPLGARWVVSTKLPFAAAALAATAIGWAFDATAWRGPLTVLNLAGVAALVGLLWTNPKEGLTPP